MFDASGTTSPWRRVERLTPSGELRDYVEVGACSRCGIGVDRAFPNEYRELDHQVVCAPCATTESRPEAAVRGTAPHNASRSATRNATASP